MRFTEKLLSVDIDLINSLWRYFTANSLPNDRSKTLIILISFLSLFLILCK